MKLNDINIHTMMNELISTAINLNIEEKDKKAFSSKINKACEKSLVYGNDNEFAQISWKGIKTLHELVSHKAGLDALQKAYDEKKANLNDGQRIHNSDEQLLSLGIKL
jgi:hypothetical protein